MSVPLLDLKAQYASIREEIDVAVMEVLESQHFILGPKVKQLEESIAEYSQCAHGIGVASGTDALLISLMSEGVGEGDEVITTPYTFFATAGCIVRTGAKPVFVDVDPVSCNMDPSLLEAAITPRTKALIPIHLYGQMVEMDPLMEIADGHGIAVIEDAAQAIGSEYKGRRAGSIGQYGCFSFFPSKNLGGAGDGGMVVTHDKKRAEMLEILRVHGGRPKYYHKFIGGNFRLDALQAAVLQVKLNHLDEWSDGRKVNAETYRRRFTEAGLVIESASEGKLEGLEGVVLPVVLPERRHIYNQFIIRSDRRDQLIEHLRGKQIGVEIYYPVPLHMQECFAYLGYREGDFPHSEAAARETLALPIYPELTEEMQGEVVEAVADFFGS